MTWDNLETFAFGDGPGLADKLAALVLAGRKRATCWVAADGMQNQVGEQLVLLDGAERRRAIIEISELKLVAYRDVDAAFAADEGEGDLTLEWWRQAHKRYFTRKQQFSEDMMLWCARFKLVEVLAE